MTSRREQLKHQIEEAFASVPYPGDERIAYAPNAWECEELNADFRGLHWTNIPRDVLRRHSDDLALFSTGGFHFYLPAYLSAALDDFWDVRGFVLSHLTPPAVSADASGQWASSLRRFEHLTPSQKNAVRACLEYFRDEAPGDLSRAQVSEALDRYWGRDWR
jgi:hypothetical protein